MEKPPKLEYMFGPGASISISPAGNALMIFNIRHSISPARGTAPEP